jgi:hypothetical protein
MGEKRDSPMIVLQPRHDETDSPKMSLLRHKLELLCILSNEIFNVIHWAQFCVGLCVVFVRAFECGVCGVCACVVRVYVHACVCACVLYKRIANLTKL